MRTTLAALSLAAGLALICCQAAAAFPVEAAPIQQAAASASAVEHTQYAERHTRHGFVKCYREFIFGHYACHTY